MNAHHKEKINRLYLQDYLPPADIEKEIGVTNDIISDISIGAETDTKQEADKKPLREYTSPTINVTLTEMENGIAANSDFAPPVKTNTFVNKI